MEIKERKKKQILLIGVIFLICATTIVFSNYLLTSNQKQTSQTKADVGNPGRDGYSSNSTSNKNDSSNLGVAGGGSLNSGNQVNSDLLARENAARKNGDNLGNVTDKNGYTKNSDGSYSYNSESDLRNPGSSNNGVSTPKTCSFGGNGSGGCGKATGDQWGLKNPDGSKYTGDPKDCPTCSTGIIKDDANSPYAAGVGGTNGVRNNSNINNQIKNGAANAAAAAQSAANAANQKLDLALKNQAAINQQIQDGIMIGSVAETNRARAEQAVKDAQAAAAAATTAAQSAADLSASLNFLFIDSTTATISSFTTSNTNKSFILGNPKNNDDYIYKCYLLKDKTSLKCNTYSDILILSDANYFCCPK